MNNQQFIFWLNGFVDAVGEEGPTPEQWGTIVSKLNQVAEPVSFPFGTPNTTPIQTLPFIQPPYPYKPYEVYCGENPSNDPYDRFKTWCRDTNGVGSVAISGSGTTNGINYVITTGTTSGTNIPNGTNVSYTANLPKELLND